MLSSPTNSRNEDLKRSVVAARAANTVSEHGAEGGAVAGGWRAKTGSKGGPSLDTVPIEAIAQTQLPTISGEHSLIRVFD